MTYKTIIVCFTNEETAKRLTLAAAAMARKFDAHLIGIHTRQSFTMFPGAMPYSTVEISQAFEESQREISARIEKIFREHTRIEEFVSEWRSVVSLFTDIGKRLAEDARCADLVIIGQPAQGGQDETGMFERELIEACGRPVLVIPHSGEFEEIGNNPLIAWSTTREATRAVHDALPFLQKAEKTTLFWVEKARSQPSLYADTGHEMAAALDRQGIKVTVGRQIRTDIPIGDEILNEAARLGSDLLIAGAYGHTRVYDFLIGATTPHLMRHMTVPVLLSG